MVLAQRFEGIAHLDGQFARRLKNERARHPRSGAALFEKSEHRQHEGRCLAGAGLGKTEHVLALKRVRNGLRLNGRRR